MRRFVAIMEGTDPQTATTILATEDSRIVRAVEREVRARLSERPELVDPFFEEDIDLDHLER